MEVEGDVLTSVKALVRQQTRINKTEERRLGGWGGFGSFSICGTSIALAAEEVVVVGQKEAFLFSEVELCRIHKSPPFILLQKSLRCQQSIVCLWAKLKLEVAQV